MSITVRKIPNNKIEQVEKLINTIGYQSFGNDTASFLATIKERRNSSLYHAFTVADDELVLGFALLSVVGSEAEILQIAVEKTTRKKGLGTVLMEGILSWCKDNEVRSMYLEVRESNRSAVKLYEKTGFEGIGKRKDYYENPFEDALIMTRRVCIGKKI